MLGLPRGPSIREQTHASQLWTLPLNQLYPKLKSRSDGLTSHEASYRLRKYGPNMIRSEIRLPWLRLLSKQFTNPIVLILIGAAILSGLLKDKTDVGIILTIVICSGLLGFFQEYGALNVVGRLLSLVENRCTVLRDKKEVSIALTKLVPGDVIVLKTGDLIPADCRLTEASNLFVDEASLTGESFSVEKTLTSPRSSGKPQKNSSIEKASHYPATVLLQGTTVASGFAKAIVVATGQQTLYSKLLEQVKFRLPETSFEIGVRRFGQMLIKVTFMLVAAVLCINILLNKPFLDALLFSLAIAVGIIPELLPAIITVNLAYGARRLAAVKVIVKRLTSLENFGQMEILCTDKTGTLTLGTAALERVISVAGEPFPKAALYAEVNARLQAGYVNVLDRAILETLSSDLSGWEKQNEIPYDFKRKCLSVLVQHAGQEILITKGAVLSVLKNCTQIERLDGSIYPLNDDLNAIHKLVEERSKQGKRLLGIAYGTSCEEKNLIFLGFLEFSDPLKPGVVEVIAALKQQGVQLKVISGDHPLVTAYIGESVGLNPKAIITGPELDALSDEALLTVVLKTDLFAFIEPIQKARILQSLRKAGRTVGFLGDGVNDVGALHNADVAIAVNNGAPASKECADIVLLEKDLVVLQQGILEGRRTFANTMKYVYMATSGNFGSMCTIALSSLLLPFLPLLPKQLLLTNFLCDLPEMALANDRVDSEILATPAHWDISFIRWFMLIFGAISATADWLTFGMIFWLSPDLGVFRAAWFVESVVTASLAVLVIRTRRLSYLSQASTLLIAAVIGVIILTLILPKTSLGALFGFAPLPWTIYLSITAISIYYIVSIEIGKFYFWRKWRSKMYSENQVTLHKPTE